MSSELYEKTRLIVWRCQARLLATVGLASAFWGIIVCFILTSHHLSLNREGRWGTTDDFTTSFLHFPLFSSALWDLANSRPVRLLMLSYHLFLCLPCLLPPFTVPCEMVLARPDKRETCPYHCSLRLFFQWPGGLRVVRLPAGSWHGLLCW